MKNGMRELSMDEMDKVNGGVGVTINGVYMDEGQIAAYASVLINNYSYDAAATMFCETFGMSKTEIKKSRAGTDEQNMGVLVQTYLRLLKKLETSDTAY